MSLTVGGLVTLAGVTHTGAVIPTVTAVTGLTAANLDVAVSTRLATAGYTAPTNLTAAQIATGVWQDAVATDFTTLSSIGKSLYTAGVAPGVANGLFIAGTNAATTVNLTGSLSGSVGSVTGLTASNLDVAVSTRLATAGYTAPTNLTAAQIASGVWQDAVAGDFTVLSSIGKSLYTAGVAPGVANGLFIAGVNAATTANITGNLSGSVGSVTGLTAANLDVAVSSRMASYAQPAGFLAAAFPLTVASTTNITAGTITTATNLTNLPAIPANWLTAAGTAPDFTTEIQVGLATAADTTAIKAKTDQLIFTSAGLVDANTRRINSTVVLGTGVVADKWRA